MSAPSTSAKRRLLRPTNSLPVDGALAHTTEAHNTRHGVKEDVTMSLMNVGWKVRKRKGCCFYLPVFGDLICVL